MVARDNLVAPRDPRRTKRASRSNGLMAAWIVLILAVAAVAAWLLANADDTRARWARLQPSAVVPLPSDVPSQWSKGGDSTPTAPATPAPTPAPVAQVPQPEPTPAPAPAAAPAPASVNPTGLTPAPDVALIEAAPVGALPKVEVLSDGSTRQPWQVYARPFDAPETKPRIAVMLTGLGLSAAPTEAAINKLPPDVTLSFSPYADKLGEWLQAARAGGHEVLIDLPLEPTNFPQHDPGPYSLLSTLTPSENVARLEWVLSRGVGYVGVVGEYGSKFATTAKNLLPMFEVLKKRGVMYVDAKATNDSVAGRVARDMGVPRAIDDRTIDEDGGRAAIDAKLAEIERLARTSGQALAFASPYPITIDRLLAWLPAAQQKGFAIAPVSAIANRQKDQ
jgi:polysaccharide deacetylase 2 family uncharacterized protein YibQ